MFSLQASNSAFNSENSPSADASVTGTKPRKAVRKSLLLREKKRATTASSFVHETSVLSSTINEYCAAVMSFKSSSLNVGPSTFVTSAAHFVLPKVTADANTESLKHPLIQGVKWSAVRKLP
ncbi:hypothetical protein MRX96_014754 [Rhipicephalus microplus]